MRIILELLLVAFFPIVDGKDSSYFKKSKGSLPANGTCVECPSTVDVLLCADHCVSQVQCTAFGYREHLYSTYLSGTVGPAVHSTSFHRVHTGSLKSRSTSSENEITLIVSGWSDSPIATFNFQSYNWTHLEGESAFSALVYHPGDGKLYFSRNSVVIFSCAWDPWPSPQRSVQSFQTTHAFAGIVTLSLDVKENFLFALIRHGKEMFEPSTLVQVVRVNLKQGEQDVVVNRTGKYMKLGNNLAVDSHSRCLFLALNGEILRYSYDLNSSPSVLWRLMPGVTTPLDFDGQVIYVGQGTTVICLMKGHGHTYLRTDACKAPADDRNVTDIIATQDLVVYMHDDGNVSMRSEDERKTLPKPGFIFISVAALVAQ